MKVLPVPYQTAEAQGGRSGRLYIAHMAGGSYRRPSRASISACSGCCLVLATSEAADTSSLLLTSSPAGCLNGASVLSASTSANAACGLLLLQHCLLQHAVATVAGCQGVTRIIYIARMSCLLVSLMKLKFLSADGESCNDKKNQGSVPGFASGIVSHGCWPFQSAEPADRWLVKQLWSNSGFLVVSRHALVALRSLREAHNVKFTSKGEVSCQIQLQGVCSTSMRSVHSAGPSHAARHGGEIQRAPLCRGAVLQPRRMSSLTAGCLQPPAVFHQGLPLPAGHYLRACQAMTGSVAR